MPRKAAAKKKPAVTVPRTETGPVVKKKKRSNRYFPSYIRKLIKESRNNFEGGQNISVSSEAVDLIDDMINKLIKDISATSKLYTLRRTSGTVSKHQVLSAAKYVLRPSKPIIVPGTDKLNSDPHRLDFPVKVCNAGELALETFSENSKKE